MKGLTLKRASMILDIGLLLAIQQSQATEIKVNFCRKTKYKQRNDVSFPSIKIKPNKLLTASIEYFKDVNSFLAEQRTLYEQIVGPHQLIIKNLGLKDFYPTIQDTKLLKLPKKRKVRAVYEIQWLLTSMVYHLKIANVVEKEFNFRKVENKIKIAVNMWKLLMNRLGLRTKRRRSSCYRHGYIQKLSTRREASKHSSIVLRDIHCALGHVIHILGRCRIRKRKHRKTRVVQYIFKCRKGVTSVFDDGRNQISPKFLSNHCERPKKFYSLSEL